MTQPMTYTPRSSLRTRRLVEDYEEQRYPYPTALDALRRYAERDPDRMAFDSGDGSLTFEDVESGSERLARGLFARGVDRGGRCCVLLPPGRDLLLVCMAVMRLGAAPVILDPALSAPTVMRRARDVRTEVLVCADRLLPALEQENRRVHGRIRLRTLEDVRSDAAIGRISDVVPSRDDAAAIVLTAGRAGASRPVIWRHRQVMAWANAMGERLSLEREDVIGCLAPMSAGWPVGWALLLPLIAGCRCVVRPVVDRPAANMVEALAENVSVLAATDSELRLLTRAAPTTVTGFQSLRLILSHGEPSRPSTVKALDKRFGCGSTVRPAYGLIESTGPVVVADDEPANGADALGLRPAGRALAGVSLVVEDDEGKAAPAGQVGVIRLKGDALTTGYFDDPNATRERMKDGWLDTGDQGYVDEEGRLYVIGQDSSLIWCRPESPVLAFVAEESATTVEGVGTVAAVGRVRRGPDRHEAREELVVVAEIASSQDQKREGMQDLSERISSGVEHAVGVAPNEVLLVESGTIPVKADGRVMHGRLRELIATGGLGRTGAILHGGDVFISPLKR